MKPRIYINGRFLTQSISGVQRYGHELLRAIDRLIAENDPTVRGMQFELLAPRDSHKHQLQLQHIPLTRGGRLGGHLWEQMELPKMARDGLLFCPGNTAPLRSLQRQPVVVTVHALSYLYYPEYYSRGFRVMYGLLIPEILKRATAVITVSESERSTILEHYPVVGDRLRAVPNGGFGRRFDAVIENTHAPRSPDLILYVGALNRSKNPQGIIQAVALLAPSSNVRLVIAGSSGKSFDNRDLGVPPEVMDRVEFLGQIEDVEHLVKLYKRARAFVFPSFYESSGLPPVEAMACGCPVVASSIPALKERCGSAAQYCDADNPETIAQAIRTLVEDDGRHAELVGLGLERAALFTWENCARETVAVLSESARELHPVAPGR